MKKVKFGMALLLMAVLICLPGLVHASSPISQDWTDNWDTPLGLHGAYQVLPSGIVAPPDSEIGTCFTTPTSATYFNVSDVEFRINGAFGAPASGTMQSIIYNVVGGVQNSTCIPNTSTGSIGFSLATSPSQIGSSTTGNVTFTFVTFPTPQVVLRGGTTYAVSVRLNGCSVCNSTNYWKMGTDSSNFDLSFRVGGTDPLTMSSSISPYYWNGTNFIPTALPTPVTFGYSTTQFTVTSSNPNASEPISVNMNSQESYIAHLSNSALPSGMTLSYPSSVSTNAGFTLLVTSTVSGQFTLFAAVGSQQTSLTFTVTVHSGGGGCGGCHPR